MTTTVNLALLELELRRLPGVTHVAIDQSATPALVEIAAPGRADRGLLVSRAEQICHAHLDPDARVVMHRARRPSRVRLVDVNVTAPDTSGGEVVVVVDYQGRIARGSGKAGHPAGPATATVRALERLGASVPFQVEAAAVFDHRRGAGVMLILNAPGHGERYGVATGTTSEAAAVRATLNALNRYLATQVLTSA